MLYKRALLVMSKLENLKSQSPLFHFLLFRFMDAHLPLQSHRFVVAVLLRHIPTFLVGLLPALLLRHLVTLLDRLLPAFLGGLFPALSLRNVDTNLTRNRDAALLGHLVTSLMGHVLALGVGDRGANFVRRCPAFGVGHLLAVLHWQLFALLPGHLLAHLVAGALLERNMFANFLSFVVRLVVMVLDMLDMDLFLLFLQSDLLRAKAYGKTSAKSKFLANVPTNHCTSEPSKKVKRTFLPNATICLDNFNNLSTFRHFNSLFLTTHIFSTIVRHLGILIHVLNFGTFIPDRPLPLLVLRLGLMVMHLDLHMVALFLLLHPAFRLVPALLLVLGMACLFIFSPTDFRIFC